MVAANNAGFPVAAYTSSARPHEVTLVRPTLQTSFSNEEPEKLIGDKAYGSDSLDEELKAEGGEMIAPHRVESEAEANAGRSGIAPLSSPVEG